MKASDFYRFRQLIYATSTALALILSYAVRANERAIEEKGNLTSEHKNKIASIINQGFGSNSVSVEELKVDGGRPVNLKATIVKRETITTVSDISTPTVYMKRTPQMFKGMETFQSKILVRTYAGKRMFESSYELHPDKKYSEYAFDPIIAPHSQHVFFKYGVKEGDSEFVPDAYGLYVLYLKTGNVIKISPEFISDSPTPVTNDGRHIVYMMPQRGKNHLFVFNTVTKTNVSVANATGLYAKYRWKQGKFPTLSYHIPKNGKIEQHSRVFND